MRKYEKGQVAILFVFLFLGLMAFISLAIEGWHLYAYNVRARSALRSACMHAASEQFKGGNATASFYEIMVANDMPNRGYMPTSGSGAGLTRGIVSDGTTIRTAVNYWDQSWMMGMLGFNDIPIIQYARCTTTGGLMTPIAVKYSAWDQSYNHNKEVDILGKGAQADVDSGKSYRGAVYPFINCVLSDGITADPNCSHQVVFPPLTVNPPSPQTAKDAEAKCWSGKVCKNIATENQTRLPIVAGTSDAQLVKAALDAGLKVGDDIIVLIYDGTVTKPDPSYGPWENVLVTGYAIFKITKTNTNTITAKAKTPILSYQDIRYYDGKFLFPVEIPWDATGGW